MMRKCGSAYASQILAVLLLIIAQADPCVAGVAEDGVKSISLSEITVREGRLWVDVKDFPVDELFLKIGESAAFEVRIDESYGEMNLTVRFNGLPLEDAISRLVRLLDTKNYRLAYRGDGSVERLEIFKQRLSRGGAAVAARGVPARGVQPPGRRAPARQASEDSGRRRRPVRRQLAPPPDEYREGDERWMEDEFRYEDEQWADEQLQEEPFEDVYDDAPYLEPTGDIQRFQ